MALLGPSLALLRTEIGGSLAGDSGSSQAEGPWPILSTFQGAGGKPEHISITTPENSGIAEENLIDLMHRHEIDHDVVQTSVPAASLHRCPHWVQADALERSPKCHLKSVSLFLELF